MQEEWRATHISEKHEVSNLGRVRSWAVRGNRNALAPVPRLMIPQIDKDGHATIWFQTVKKRAYVHTLLLTAFVGPRPEKFVCRHLDGNPSNNLISNICWGTDAENKADARLHGTSPDGSRCGTAKLTEQDVEEIRNSTAPRADLAAHYRVVPKTISRIRRGHTWKEHLRARAKSLNLTPRPAL